MEPMGGAAPPSPVYETGALLLSYTGLKSWSTVRGSSPVLAALQAVAFPFRQRCLAEGGRVELPARLRGSRLANALG